MVYYRRKAKNLNRPNDILVHNGLGMIGGIKPEDMDLFLKDNSGEWDGPLEKKDGWKWVIIK